MTGGIKMKFILLFICLLSATSLWGKPGVDFKSFSKSVNQNIDQTIQNNPQLYETRPVNREPASLKKIDDESTEKLDAIDEHADSHMAW